MKFSSGPERSAADKQGKAVLKEEQSSGRVEQSPNSALQRRADLMQGPEARKRKRNRVIKIAGGSS